MSAAQVRRFAQAALVVMFLVAISVPLLGKFLPGAASFTGTENRRPAPLPTVHFGAPGWGFSLVSFPLRFERYWDDSFAFRQYLIRWHSIASLRMGVSPSPKVVVGTGDYLFYAAEQSVDYFRAIKPFTPHEVAHWRDDLESRRQWLAERGIRYLVVVAPSKETIYPEFMPAELRPVRAETRLDQLVAELRAHSAVELLDLRPALRDAKAAQRIYHRTDTHWNDAGAAIAYREILARVHAWFPDIDAATAAGKLAVSNTAGGDLARVLALDDRFREDRIEFIPALPRRAVAVHADKDGASDVTVIECAGCRGPRVVMNQDSFNTNLAPLLAEHFPRLVLVDGTRLNRALIEREKPALVIQEFVERVLMCPDLRSC